MTTKPQTKSNAKRSAESATRRTGIEHTVQEVDGGWVVMTPAPDTAGTEVASQNLKEFTREVAGFLEAEGCGAVITTEDEARTMIEDGHANGRPAARVAGDILAWLAESEADAEEAGADVNDAPSAEEPHEEPGTPWIDTESRAVADALEADKRREDDAPPPPDTDPGETPADTATGASEGNDGAPRAPKTANLRQAAQAILDAWHDETNRETDIIAALEGPMATLRTALGERTARTPSTAPRKPREGTKQELVLTMLRRDEGASGPQIAEATGWASHTVRGFLAGLKKKGIKVETLERVRMVGPNTDGAKGSFTIYKVAA